MAWPNPPQRPLACSHPGGRNSAKRRTVGDLDSWQTGLWISWLWRQACEGVARCPGPRPSREYNFLFKSSSDWRGGGWSHLYEFIFWYAFPLSHFFNVILVHFLHVSFFHILVYTNIKSCLTRGHIGPIIGSWHLTQSTTPHCSCPAWITRPSFSLINSTNLTCCSRCPPNSI